MMCSRCMEVAPWSKSNIASELKKFTTSKHKIAQLKDQINLYVKGYGWSKLKIHFSSKHNSYIGTEKHLTNHLISIHDTMKKENLQPPSEPPLPTSRTSALPTMGTLCVDVHALKRSGWSRGELQDAVKEVELKLEKIQRARFDEHALEQPLDCGPIDESLVGRRIEVNCLCTQPSEANPDIEEDFKQWLEATITQVSDGTATRKGKGKRKLVVPKGLCLVSFNDGLVEWKKLNADTCNNTHDDSWRFDLDYDEQVYFYYIYFLTTNPNPNFPTT